MSEQNYRFIFIVGAEGSGTTMLTRILSAPKNAVGLGGNFTTIKDSEKEAFALVEQFDNANADLWDRKASHEICLRAKGELPRLISRLRHLEDYAKVSHVVYKRSAPFFKDDRFRPDLADLPEIFEDLRIILIYRDPRACTFSALRRGFGENLRQCAVITEEQLTYLAAQLATLDAASYRVISYEKFCAEPEALTSQLAEFCGLPEMALGRAVIKEKLDPATNDRWQQELTAADRDFLNKFFDDRRLAQWQLILDKF